MVPKRVFIVPYKNRIQHKYFFSIYMTQVILQDQSDYEIYFSHQTDARPFNRGGVKNIGFMAIKQKYPNDYKDITFIFNDIDTVPFTNIFTYETTPSIVKHYYGFTYALGGIVVIKGRDFEKLNGYPCYWGWGNEDNLLNNRCLTHGLTIDRSEFLPIGSPQILQLFDGISRLINKSDFMRAFKDNGLDGICTISNLEYTIDTASSNQMDNIFKIEHPNIFYINIVNFKPLIPVDIEKYSKYDLRDPASAVLPKNKMELITDDTVQYDDISTINDWTVIPNNPIQKNNSKMIPYAKNIDRGPPQQQQLPQFQATANSNQPPPQYRIQPNQIINNAYKNNNNKLKNILNKKLLFF